MVRQIGASLAMYVSSCKPSHLGGSDGMSEVQRHDDVRAVFRFLSHFLRMEVYQLRRDHRSHDLQ